MNWWAISTSTWMPRWRTSEPERFGAAGRQQLDAVRAPALPRPARCADSQGRITTPQGSGHVQAEECDQRLAAIRKLIFEVIPQDPGRAEFRQGKALGEQHTHWFRAKFFQQYRLFFRYHASSKIIVYAWVNDASTLRAYESKSDAYRVFRRMLDSGNPPDDWETLLVEAERAKERFRRGS